MSRRPPQLFELLPAFYRYLDAVEGERVLQAWMQLLQGPYEALHADIERLYEAWFVETCEEWLTPYIGQLVGTEGLESHVPGGPSARAMVGNTLRHRRRKGIAAVMGSAVADASGWATHVVESGRIVAGSADVAAGLPEAPRLPDLRTLVATAGDGPWTNDPHVADLRTPGQDGGLAPSDLLLYVWRRQAYPMERIDPRALPGRAGRWWLDPFGLDRPAVNLPRTRTRFDLPTTPADLPVRLDRRRLARDLDAYRACHATTPPLARPRNSDLVGPERGLHLWTLLGGQRVGPLDLVVADLADWRRPLPLAAARRGGRCATQRPLLPDGGRVALDGPQGPLVLVLEGLVDTPADAARALTASLVAAGDSPGQLRVEVADDRLVLIDTAPGQAPPPALRPMPGDPAGRRLGLSEVGEGTAVLLGRSADPVELLPPHLVLQVRWAGQLRILQVPGPFPDLSAVAAGLQAALTSADPDPAWAEARVLALDDRLLLLPGRDLPGAWLRVSPTPGDPGSAALLGLSPVIALDPQLGRFAFGLYEEPPPELPPLAAVTLGRGGPIGAGTGPALEVPDWQPPSGRPLWRGVVPAHAPAAEGEVAFAALEDAVAAWQLAGQPGVLRIADSRTRRLSRALALSPHPLWIVASPGCTPHLAGDVVLDLALPADQPPVGVLTLQGLAIEGGLSLPATVQLRLANCTVHGGVACRVEGRGAHVDLFASRCLLGPLRVTASKAHLALEACVIDGGRGPALVLPEDEHDVQLSLTHCTLLGGAPATALSVATGCLVVGPAHVPEHELCSLSPADPEYARLRPDAPTWLRGLRDGVPGAFHVVQDGRRMHRLRAMVAAYTPAHLDVGVMILA